MFVCDSNCVSHKINVKTDKRLSTRIFLLFMIYLIQLRRFIAANSLVNFDQCSEVCLTNICKDEASFYLKTMDQEVQPCENFYEFVCGNYLRNIKIPNDQSEINFFYNIYKNIEKNLLAEFQSEIKLNEIKTIQKLKIYYQNCMDTSRIEQEGIQPLITILNQIGGWPVLENNWSADTFSVEESISKINALGINTIIPFTIIISDDLVDSTKRILKVASPDLIVNAQFFYDNNRILNAYESYMIDIAVMLGANKDTAQKDMKECLDLEIKLHGMQNFVEESDDTLLKTNRDTIKNISEKYPDLCWLNIINRILSSSNVFVDEDEIIEIEDTVFIKDIGLVLKNTPKRVIANFQIWHLINFLIAVMPQKFIQRNMIFNQIREGTNDQSERTMQCFYDIYLRFPIAVGATYIRKYFSQQIKNEVEELVKDIKFQAKTIIENVDWMDLKTRKAALEKLNAMSAFVAYPDELLDDNIIENYHEDLKIQTDGYLYSFLKAVMFEKNQNLKNFKRSLNETEWIFNAAVAELNAYYVPKKNQIFLPAGILQGRIFRSERPKYLNYGSLGYSIGHEVTHGFDSIGRRYDKYGNLKNWWESVTEAKFNNKSKCFVDQYSKYTVKQIKAKVDGKWTLSENLADNGGIRLAYQSYQHFIKNSIKKESCLPDINYSPQQMFWISAASTWCSKSTDEALRYSIFTHPHSPSEARVNVAFSNIPEFANDFKCVSGSTMNPEKKCEVW